MSTQVNAEMVNHPNHYQAPNGLETIDVMEGFTDGMDNVEAINTAQAIRYICRWNKKENPIQDIEKAMWYLERLKNYLVNKKENAQ